MTSDRGGPCDTLTVVFLHLPRTAGSTMLSILRHRYSKQTTFFTTPHQPDFGLGILYGLSQPERDRLCLIAGHMPYGIHDHFSHHVGYFTFVRDPVERSISDYYFVQNQPPTHYLHRYANALSLPDYLEYRASIARDNVQTRLISGLWDSVPFDPRNDALLEQAKQNLKKNFIMVGLAERFDESLVILKRLLDLRRIYYTPRNVNPSCPRSENLPESTIKSLRYYNQLDHKLYLFSRALFQKQIAAYGPCFYGDLQKFVKRNMIIGGGMKLYSNMIGALGHAVKKMVYSGTAFVNTTKEG